MSVTIEQAKAALARRTLARREEGEQRAALLRSRLPMIARLLRSEYGVTSIRLFGSLARGDAHGRSDIDLAVEGLDAGRYFEALGEVMGLAQCPIDLVRLETAPASLRECIATDSEAL